MTKVVISFDDKEVEELKMIVNDDDKNEALDFIRNKVYKKVNDALRERKCGPKS